MPRIAIIPLSERSHYLPVLALAESLRSAGHEVVFLGTVDFEPLVSERGFEFQTVFPELFPAGSSTAVTPAPPLRFLLTHPRRAVFAWRASRARARLQRSLLKRERRGELSATFAANVDLFLVDSFLALVSIALTRYAKPILQFNVTLAASASPSLPPTTQFAAPHPGVFGSLSTRARWLRVALQRALAAQLSRVLGFDYLSEARQLAECSGFPIAELSEASEYALRVRLPELVLCPREFDFPHTPPPHRFYVGPCTAQRTAAPEFVAGSRPLIYCAFGSQLHRFANAPRILATIWETFRDQSEFALLLVVDDRIPLRGSAPQLQRIAHCNQPELLNHAALMITHAGLGSIKECIRARVPMVALPLGRDQPGNAARICFHRLGESIAPRQLTGELLLTTIRRVVADSEIAAALLAQQQALLELEHAHGAVPIVNAALAKRSC